MNIDKDKYIAHINDKEQIINMRRVLDKIEVVLRRHSIETTDFMNPYERKLAKSILDQFMDISYRESGGLNSSERKIISIYPDYYEYRELKIPIDYLMIDGFVEKLSHRDFLGAILNLGINRDKIGDILIHNEYAQIIVKDEISSFILMNLERVGSGKVSIKEIELEILVPGIIDYKEIITTISSLRLDVLLSGALNLSRNDSKKIIGASKVKVNWEPIDKVFQEVEERDIISVKGYGRFILYSIKGISRKGKMRIKLRLLK